MKRFIVTLFVAGTSLEAGANTLSRAYVYQVESAAAGIEIVAGRSSTSRNHGGSWMRIVTEDIGYGGNAQARLLGSPLRQMSKEPICQRGNTVGRCNRGDTVIGYRRTWDASGREGGNFEYTVMPQGAGQTIRVGFQVQ